MSVNVFTLILFMVFNIVLISRNAIGGRLMARERLAQLVSSGRRPACAVRQECAQEIVTLRRGEEQRSALTSRNPNQNYVKTRNGFSHDS